MSRITEAAADGFEGFDLYEFVSVPRTKREERDPTSGHLFASVVSAHAELSHAAAEGAALALAWVRTEPNGRIRFIVGGRPMFPLVGDAGDVVAASGGEWSPGEERTPGLTLDQGTVPLLFPPGSFARRVNPAPITSALEALPMWIRCLGQSDALGIVEEGVDARVRGSFEDYVKHLPGVPFAWLILAEPAPASDIDTELKRVSADIPGFQKRVSVATDQVALQRAQVRLRELIRARTAGLWRVHAFVGARSESVARRVSALLCSGADLAKLPYVLTPDTRSASFAEVVTTSVSGLPGAGDSPFSATSELVAAIARPPVKELQGIRLVVPHTFDVTSETGWDGTGIVLGTILDSARSPAGPMVIGRNTLLRHTFVCGATGSGKSQTIRGLLESATRAKPDGRQGIDYGGPENLHWLVIEPAKAEYARMAGRVSDVSSVVAIAPGDRASPPGSINPLEPATLDAGNPDKTFPLQSHADLIRALFLAAFQADEPFPQVLSRALTECYERAGWDLVTGEPLIRWSAATGQPPIGRESRWSLPRYPTLRDLQHQARVVVEQIGYDKEAKERVRGFVDVRIGSLRLGTPGRFFEGGHPLDFAELLRRNVVFELEGVTNDQDKSFVMGSVLIRLYEQLLIEDRERGRGDRGSRPLRHISVIEEAHRLLRNVVGDSPGAYAVELFTNLLAEVRAYGEGIVIAEQIPSKIISDAIKNTALKIVHRLPAEDDRTAVGATMNLSPDQSEFVVTLNPGDAATFADGMDNPILVRMPLGEDREGAEAALRIPPLSGRRSQACGADCVKGAPCTLLQIRTAERLLQRHPELTFWMEITCAAHIMGRRTPGFAKGHGIDELRDSDERLVDCAVAHAVEQAIEHRYDALKEFYDPAAFGAHLAEAAKHALFPAVGASPCISDAGRWRAGRGRFGDIQTVLKELARRGDADDRVAQLARERGVELPLGAPEIQLSFLEYLPRKRYTDEEQVRLQVGSQTPALVHTSAAVLSGPGNQRHQVNMACELLTWKDPVDPEMLAEGVSEPTQSLEERTRHGN